MKKYYLILISLFFSLQAIATHNRAGEISYRWISGLTYEVTITTYTKDTAPADRCTLDVDWGDNTTNTLLRSNGLLNALVCPTARVGEIIATDIRKNTYVGTHTYNATGVYTIHFEDPNRNSGINNIVQSINVPFYVNSELVVSPGLGSNSSPILLNPPIDDGCLNKIFKHNTGAYDPDGDSLSYRLVDCRGALGNIISTTYDPLFVQDSIIIDPVTGNFIWDVPKRIGVYNFAIQISEFRKNASGQYVRVGFVVRDMQIEIKDCGNNPPVIAPVGPFCVEAGQNLNFTVSATDPDNDRINMSAYGAPFEVANPANPFQASGLGSVNAIFNWNTACNHIRKQAYFVTFEAKDNPSDPNEPSLTDLFTAEITVVAPSPKNPKIEANDRKMVLHWNPAACSGSERYDIYRRESLYGFVPNDCELGVPARTGYSFIGSTSGGLDTNYIDSTNLKVGVEYCYMVVAVYPQETESYASVEFCSSLALSLPLMTKVDILNTSTTEGKIDIEWIAPPFIDSVLNPPPYSYTLSRSIGFGDGLYTDIGTFADAPINSFRDSLLNTQDTSYSYKVTMFSGNPAQVLGESDPASSVFLQVFAEDELALLRFNYNTSWRNDSFVIFRENLIIPNQFDSIGISKSDLFIDTALSNGETYCYRVRSYGDYTAQPNLSGLLINNSQIDCGIPIDTSRPCPPVLSANFNCEEDSLFLSWQSTPSLECSIGDIAYYNIYYKKTRDDEYSSTPLVAGVTSLSFLFLNEPIFGCYAVTAVDDAASDPNGIANESLLSNEICIEACPIIEFPNVFSPNGDDNNDSFRPINYNDIGRISLVIKNRWGTTVFESSDLDEIIIGWNGQIRSSGETAVEGVYFYTCIYEPQSVNGRQERSISGFLHLYK